MIFAVLFLKNLRSAHRHFRLISPMWDIIMLEVAKLLFSPDLPLLDRG